MTSAAALTPITSATVLDETLLAETDRAIVIRFGRRHDPLTQQADEQLARAAAELEDILHAFTVDLDDVQDFTVMYQLADPVSVMCFYRNKPLLLEVVGSMGWMDPKICPQIWQPITSSDYVRILGKSIRAARAGEEGDAAEDADSWVSDVLPKEVVHSLPSNPFTGANPFANLADSLPSRADIQSTVAGANPFAGLANSLPSRADIQSHVAAANPFTGAKNPFAGLRSPFAASTSTEQAAGSSSQSDRR